jgi:hypothetical protein
MTMKATITSCIDQKNSGRAQPNHIQMLHEDMIMKIWQKARYQLLIYALKNADIRGENRQKSTNTDQISMIVSSKDCTGTVQYSES